MRNSIIRRLCPGVLVLVTVIIGTSQEHPSSLDVRLALTLRPAIARNDLLATSTAQLGTSSATYVTEDGVCDCIAVWFWNPVEKVWVLADVEWYCAFLRIIT